MQQLEYNVLPTGEDGDDQDDDQEGDRGGSSSRRRTKKEEEGQRVADDGTVSQPGSQGSHI